MNNFKTKYGHFSEDGKEYIIIDPYTPKPWINVISNGHYGLVVSQLNGGFSWLGNSNLNRLTRWHQDLVMDNWGKYLYLRDNDSGEYWSPTVQPVPLKMDFFECRHGIGYTKFKSVYKKIESNLRIFIPFDDDLEIWTLKIKNRGSNKREISVFTYFEWLLGCAPDNHREFHKTFINTQFDEKNQILFAGKRLWEVAAERGHWNTDWPLTAYFCCSENVDGFDGDKQAFIGRYRTLNNPVALETGELSAKTGSWNDSIAALKKTVVLDAGQEVCLHFFLGAESTNQKIIEKVKQYRSDVFIQSKFEEVHERWNTHLDATTVETPDDALNIMTNTWLKYQAISGRLWAKAAYYQQSGAFGFRDQLQDSQIFLYSTPELTKKQILLHAAHQFKSGKVLHWWHPLTDKGLATEMTDDLLWLPFILVQYLKETADWEILNIKIPYYDDPLQESLLAHCLAAIDMVLTRFSKRGLPLILEGDWNDGLSAVGLEGKGESIWLAQFLYKVLSETLIILEKTGKSARAETYRFKAENLKKAINTFGWDGQWFSRATKDNGDLLGSHTNTEGKIFLNPQVWSVISGAADQGRGEQAMAAAVNYLECDVGMQLFTPAYSTPDSYIGYLSRYAPGVRENGGVYSHAATWTIWAANLLNDRDLAYRVYKKLCPVYNGMNPDKYMAEPYVTAGNIDGRDSENYGRGGWTWYTGSAAWLYRVTIDYLFGVSADYEGLHIKPCLPPEWKEAKLKRLFRGTVYDFSFQQKDDLSKGKIEIYVDDVKLSGNIIKNDAEAKNVKIFIYLGIK